MRGVLSLDRASARWTRLFLLGTLAIAADAVAQTAVAPLVGQWSYAENRCGVQKSGYPSETAAVTGGANRNYYYTRLCPWSYEPYRGWGTPQDTTRGSCGSTQRYPRFNLGIESQNTRPYKITYRFRETCEYGPVSDGLTVYRTRSVACPSGYSRSGNRCIVPATSVNPHKNNSGCAAGENGTNPIHCALGHKLQHEVDLDHGAGLRFERFYSSAPHWGATSMGRHWRHGYSARISLSDGSATGGLVTAWAHRPNGDLLAFNRANDASWVGDPDIKLELLAEYASPGVVSGWVIQDEDENSEFYDADGRLIGIDNPREGLMTLGYDSQGRLAFVADRHDRMIAFGYDAANRISEITGPAGNVFGYQYDAAGNLATVTYPVASGTAAEIQYHYEDSRFPHALTGITDESGNRSASWSYDASGFFHEAIHYGLDYVDASNPREEETAVRRETMNCVSCATKYDADGTRL